MSDKKNEITDEEMKDATGGAGYTLSSEKAESRGVYPSGTQGTEPGGAGSTDPIYGELGDARLGQVKGGAATTPGSEVKPTQEGSDFYRDNEPETDPNTQGTHERGSMGGQVK
jgi:hypothetical protein